MNSKSQSDDWLKKGLDDNVLTLIAKLKLVTSLRW